MFGTQFACYNSRKIHSIPAEPFKCSKFPYQLSTAFRPRLPACNRISYSATAVLRLGIASTNATTFSSNVGTVLNYNGPTTRGGYSTVSQVTTLQPPTTTMSASPTSQTYLEGILKQKHTGYSGLTKVRMSFSQIIIVEMIEYEISWYCTRQLQCRLRSTSYWLSGSRPDEKCLARSKSRLTDRVQWTTTKKTMLQWELFLYFFEHGQDTHNASKTTTSFLVCFILCSHSDYQFSY